MSARLECTGVQHDHWAQGVGCLRYKLAISLYTYPTEGQKRLGLERQANLDKEFVEAVGSSLGLEFVSYGYGDLRESFGPEDVLYYIYAVLHGPEYRRRYADFLKSDFPRVPMTSDRSLFAALVGLGKRLVTPPPDGV